MSHQTEADRWIELLELTPHPEGGYFRETYRADEHVARDALPERYPDGRAFSTAIYFLLKSEQVSVFHRLKSDEIWHYYAGSPIDLHLLHPDGRLEVAPLGPRLERGQRFQGLIPRGSWFGGVVIEPDSFTLLGCTVAPGFDFGDFEIGDRAELQAAFPQHADLIARLTAP